MFIRLTIYLCLALVCTNNVSCQTSSQKTNSTKTVDPTKLATDDFFHQVLQLNEFKQEQKRADSISKISSVSIKVSVDIVDNSFLDEDKRKHISLAFINEQYPYENRTMYIVKFDKDRKKIISIDKQEKQFGKDDLAAPEDIPLPTKN
jgi:hypothetical protein